MDIRLLIAEDHATVREGLRLTFAGTGIKVVAEAGDGMEAFELVQQNQVDVALVDSHMPRADAVRFLELLQSSHLNLPVVIYSIDDGFQLVRRCRELGAKGVLIKGMHEREELLRAVRLVYAGHQLWSCFEFGDQLG